MLSALIFAGLAVSAFGSVCTSPKATPSSFSTTDAFFHSSTTFIVEVVLECGNGAKGIPLYASVGGRLLSAAVSEETGRYQVSWTEEHDKAPAGTYKLDFFDEDGYSALRKAEREGGAAPAALFSVEHRHAGASRAGFLSSEGVMTVAAAAVFYVAYSWRASLQA